MSHFKNLSTGKVVAVCAIIAVVTAVIYPAFSRSQDKVAQITCASNEKQLGDAILQYAQENDGMLPASTQSSRAGWAGQIYPYVKCVGVFRCPDDPTPVAGADPVVSYGINADAARHPLLAKYSVPSHTVLLFEVTGVKAKIGRLGEGASRDATAFSAAGDGTDGMLNAGHAAPKYATGDIGGRTNTSTTQFTSPRHDAGSNFVFADGHVKWSQPGRISSGANAVRPTDGQRGTIHGTAAGTRNAAYVGTFSVR